MMFPKSPRIKLSPARYRKLKEYIYDRDGECVICKDQRTAECHHVVKRSAGGDDAAYNLVRLCSPCHARIERYELCLPDNVFEMLKNEIGGMK